MLTYISDLHRRNLPEQAGFAAKLGGKYRPDATAWAVMALSAAGEQNDVLRSSGLRLTMSQMEDGSIPLSTDHPEAIWPTPWAILAWKDFSEFAEPLQRATDFLLKTTGKHWEKKSDSPMGHDSAIKGWPWIADTHSWVEPTALAIIALRVIGYENHDRTREAAAMLMNRQLNRGGWNYGNTIVFGRELHPMPETTGMALAALGGLVPEKHVGNSLDYLDNYVIRTKTPLSLGWGILGLGAFNRRPAKVEEKLHGCLNRQERYGPFDTTALSLLILALHADEGLIDIFLKSHDNL